MINTTIDLIRIPVNDNGDVIIDYEEAKSIQEAYRQVFPERKALMLPANVTIWEDLDLITLKNIRDFLNEIIKEKEQI